jgi:hypothetical protein
MDLRHYDTVGHGLPVTYEDYEPVRAGVHGCANTSELTLWALPATPSPAAFAAMGALVEAPPLLHCAPEHLHATKTLGYWSLPGQPCPGLSATDVAAADEQLYRAFAFFAGEVERRR